MDFLKNKNTRRIEVAPTAAGGLAARGKKNIGKAVELFSRGCRLGYPNAYFNDRAVAVIDELLTTPEPEQPIPLVRPHVLYEYADPELEALSAGQKLLLRMGPDHAARVKAVLAEIRQRIAQAP